MAGIMSLGVHYAQFIPWQFPSVLEHPKVVLAARIARASSRLTTSSVATSAKPRLIPSATDSS